MARQLTWFPAGGGAGLVLTDRGQGRRVLDGVRGLGVPPVELVTEDSPLLDGTTVHAVHAPPRTLFLPMLLFGADRAAYRARVAALEAAMDPAAGDGQLELMEHDGSRRRIRCRYTGGMEGEETKDARGNSWWRFGVNLFAADPFWFAPDLLTLTWSYGTPTNFFPFFPLVLTPSALLGSATVSYPGTAPGWPTWRITAPGSSVTITNSDTGEAITLTGSIPAGQTLTIVTKPGQQSIRLANGTDWWPNLVDGSVLWQVKPGTTNINLSLTGASTGSSVVMETEIRYRSGS